MPEPRQTTPVRLRRREPLLLLVPLHSSWVPVWSPFLDAEGFAEDLDQILRNSRRDLRPPRGVWWGLCRVRPDSCHCLVPISIEIVEEFLGGFGDFGVEGEVLAVDLDGG